MINGFFNEQINKNNVLIDESNMLDFYCIDKFNGNKLFKIASYKKYGYVFISAIGIVGEMIVSYNGVNIKIIKKDGDYFIPINYISGELLGINGTCENVVLKLYGGIFEFKKLSKLMPLNRSICLGEKNNMVCSYDNTASIVNNTYSNQKSYGVNSFVQTFVKNGDVGLGILDCENGLIFSNNFDNFEEKLVVSNQDVTDAIFVQKYSDNYIVFIYIRDNNVFYRRYNILTNVVSEEEKLVTRGAVLGLISSTVNVFDVKFFAVATNEGVSVYVVKSNLNIEKVFESKISNLRIFEYDKSINLAIFNSYTTKLICFDVDMDKNASGVLAYKYSNIYNNVIDVLELENTYIYTNVSGDKNVCD